MRNYQKVVNKSSLIWLRMKTLSLEHGARAELKPGFVEMLPSKDISKDNSSV